MDASAPTTLHLPRGASLLQRADAGTELSVRRGVLQLTEACRQVADQPLSRTTRIDCGPPHRIDESGWITLTALSDCELDVAAPPARLGALGLDRIQRIIASLCRPPRRARS